MTCGFGLLAVVIGSSLEEEEEASRRRELELRIGKLPMSKGHRFWDGIGSSIHGVYRLVPRVFDNTAGKVSDILLSCSIKIVSCNSGRC